MIATAALDPGDIDETISTC